MTVRNAAGRELPDHLPGLAARPPFAGAFARVPEGRRAAKPLRASARRHDKVLRDLDSVIDACGIRDGMTISFHHHLRDGDFVVNRVLDALARRGIRDLRIAPTALFSVHREVLRHIEAGVVTSIEGSLNGPIGRRVSAGLFDRPVVLRSHGGRARAIEAGELAIDVAFLAAPACDRFGNLSGRTGPSACGSLGYALTDAQYADRVVAVTDHLVDSAMGGTLIDQTLIDHVLVVDRIGDPKGIVSGTTKITEDPGRLLVAKLAADLIEAAGLLVDGFSFQTGAGGISLAVAKFVRERMIERKVKGSFGAGGITAQFVRMLEEGLFTGLYDVQSFDLDAVASLARNANHFEMSASMYGNPWNAGCLVDRLDAVILGATECDLSFHVNVNTEADGALLHGIGGHQDTAAGAKLTIVTAPLTRGRIPLVVERATTVTTPGETVDAIVTERGIAVNPARPELADAGRAAGLPIVAIEELYERCLNLCGRPDPIEYEDRIVAAIEYRDGTLLDVVRKAAD